MKFQRITGVSPLISHSRKSTLDTSMHERRSTYYNGLLPGSRKYHSRVKVLVDEKFSNGSIRIIPDHLNIQKRYLSLAEVIDWHPP